MNFTTEEWLTGAQQEESNDLRPKISRLPLFERD
jgi:hypothetical protein